MTHVPQCTKRIESITWVPRGVRGEDHFTKERSLESHFYLSVPGGGGYRSHVLQYTSRRSGLEDYCFKRRSLETITSVLQEEKAKGPMYGMCPRRREQENDFTKKRVRS
jgi:hypothetical protein